MTMDEERAVEIVRKANDALAATTAEIVRLRAENERLRTALATIGSPLYSVKATGEDAHLMAQFARATLEGDA